jgi:hypothetical protein
MEIRSPKKLKLRNFEEFWNDSNIYPNYYTQFFPVKISSPKKPVAPVEISSPKKSKSKRKFVVSEEEDPEVIKKQKAKSPSKKEKKAEKAEKAEKLKKKALKMLYGIDEEEDQEEKPPSKKPVKKKSPKKDVRNFVVSDGEDTEEEDPDVIKQKRKEIREYNKNQRVAKAPLVQQKPKSPVRLTKAPSPVKKPPTAVAKPDRPGTISDKELELQRLISRYKDMMRIRNSDQVQDPTVRSGFFI